MLRVFKASGEKALALAVTDVEEQPVRVLAIKRHLHRLTGQPRFKQRLVLSDGQMPADDVVLEGPMDLQLILRPFEASSQEQIRRLLQTAADNHIPAIEQLLKRPQNPNLEDAHGWVALHAACRHGCTVAVRLLLEANADKDKATNGGATSLFIASEKGHLEVVRLLLEASADKDKATNYCEASLFIASQEGHLEVVRLLREAHADKDKATNYGTTSLFVASARGHLEVVRLLLDANADKDRAADHGETPISIARQGGHDDVVRLLLETDMGTVSGSSLKRRRTE